MRSGRNAMATIDRRQLISTSGSAALLALGGTRASAQGTTDWPTRPVRVIANYQPGGGLDAVTRPFMDRLSRMLGQQFVVDNKGGASVALGIEAAIKSAPDGY